MTDSRDDLAARAQATLQSRENGGRDDRPRLPAELIEKLRQTGIRLDRNGRLWHQGTEITHPGLRRALLRWLDRLPDGRPILRLDERRYAYLDVEDAHLLAVSAVWRDDRVYLRLNDGTEEELDYASLCTGADHALYCRVRGGALRARLTTPAYHALADCITELTDPVSDPASSPDGDPPAYALRACGQLFPIVEGGVA